jgi:hypothetical protein
MNQSTCYVGSQMNEIPESCRNFGRGGPAGDHGTQCVTEVRQSHYGKCRVKDSVVVGYWTGAPGENSIHNQSVENALEEQVKDTMGDALRSVHRCECERKKKEKKKGFVDKKNRRGSGSAVQRSPKLWQVDRPQRSAV